MPDFTPKGFWSYARGDDEHLGGRLSELRKRVAGEISMLLGRELDMFQDIYDIRTGEKWEERLRAELTAASFMVPVLTPRYFARDWCREELTAFVRMAEEAGRAPLLFPIYYVDDGEAKRCEVREAVFRHQYLDWRELRFESDPTLTERAIHEFARDVFKALKGAGAGTARPPAPEPRREARPQPVGGAETMAEEAHSAPPRRIVSELVVDPWPGNGDFTTISSAIAAAEPGSRIFIRPGDYPENLMLDKALELIGDGAREDIRVVVSEGHAMHVTAAMARVSTLTLLRSAGEGKGVALWVTAGRAAFEDCAFSSKSLSAVVVKGAAPSFRRCRFHDSTQSGLFVHENARPRIEDCELVGNGLHGLAIKTGAEPVLRRCVLRGNTYDGAFVYENGRGTLEDCELIGNGFDGVATQEGGAPTVRRCTLADNQRYGVRTEDAESGGTFEGNTLRDNRRGNWSFAPGSEKNVVRRDNTEE